MSLFKKTQSWIIDSVTEGDANFILLGWFAQAECWVTVSGEVTLSDYVYGRAIFTLTNDQHSAKAFVKARCSQHYSRIIRSVGIHLSDFPSISDELARCNGENLFRKEGSIKQALHLNQESIIDGLLEAVAQDLKLHGESPIFNSRELLISPKNLTDKAQGLLSKYNAKMMLGESPSAKETELVNAYHKASELVLEYPAHFKLPSNH